MKPDRPTWIGITILTLLLATPLVLGHIPSLPRKSGRGWTEPINLRDEPQRFWTYEVSAAFGGLAIFALSRLGRKISRR